MHLSLNHKLIPIIEANTFSKRLVGLIGKKEIDFGMFFPKCNSIHTYLMKEEIDVLGLNEKNEIIFIERNLEKNKIIKINRSIKKTSILELPKDTSKEITMGSILLFEDEDII